MHQRDITHPGGRLWYSFESKGGLVQEFVETLIGENQTRSG
jgi:hypothetical protein